MIGSQTQGQRDSDRNNCRWTMEQTQGQTAMDMDWGTQTGPEGQERNKDREARIGKRNIDRERDRKTGTGTLGQG